MDVTNRIIIIGGALLFIFLVFVVILLAWGAPEESIARLADLAAYLEDQNTTTTKLIITLGGLILALLAALVIVLEVAPPETGSLRVERVGAGEARISTDEIVHRVEQALRLHPQIEDAQVTVLGRGQKAEVHLDLHVRAEADLAQTADEACRRTRELIEGQMGVGLAGPPRAQLHYRELRLTRPHQTSTSTGSHTPPPTPTPQAPNDPSTPPTTTMPGASLATGEAHETTQRAEEDRPAGA